MHSDIIVSTNVFLPRNSINSKKKRNLPDRIAGVKCFVSLEPDTHKRSSQLILHFAEFLHQLRIIYDNIHAMFFSSKFLNNSRKMFFF